MAGGVWLVGTGRSVSTCKFVRVMPMNHVVGVWKSPAAWFGIPGGFWVWRSLLKLYALVHHLSSMFFFIICISSHLLYFLNFYVLGDVARMEYGGCF